MSSQLNRLQQFTVLVLAGFVTGYIAWWFYCATHYSDWVAQISLGDDEAKVLAVVGHPVMVNSAPGHIWCREPEVVRELMYGTSVVASWDVIGLSRDDKVACKLKLNSP